MNLHATAEPFQWPIMVYMIVAGTSAGAAITGCVAMLSKAKGLTSVRHSSFVVAVFLIGAGGPFLILDLEKPQMFFYILYYFNPKSVIAWGARAITLYFALLLFIVVIKRYIEGAKLLLKPTAMLTLLLAIAIGLYPGYVLNQSVARPLWSHPVLPFLFLLSGLHMGIAAVSLARLWSKTAPNFEPQPGDPFVHDHMLLRRLEGVLIALQIVLLGTYFLLSGAAPDALMRLTRGGYGVLLWGGIVLIGWVLPGLDMIFRGARSCLWARSLCVVVGGVCLRILIISGGQGAAVFVGSGQ